MRDARPMMVGPSGVCAGRFAGNKRAATQTPLAIVLRTPRRSIS